MKELSKEELLWCIDELKATIEYFKKQSYFSWTDESKGMRIEKALEQIYKLVENKSRVSKELVATLVYEILCVAKYMPLNDEKKIGYNKAMAMLQEAGVEIEE